MPKHAPILVQFFQNPKCSNSFNNTQWMLLLTQARASQLLGCLAHHISLLNFDTTIPTKVLNHLNAARLVSLRQKQQTLRELIEIKQLFSNKPYFIALLKGAAYIALELPNHHGRTFSDIDLITTKEDLKQAEYSFLFNDWMHTGVDDYDDQYYRKWMHEIPPLYHPKRKTVIDLHHNILPLTNKHYFDAKQFKFQTTHIKQVGEVTLLADEDLLIHTAVHLFTEGEFHHGLRDLLDLFQIMQHFEQQQTGFLLRTFERSVFLNVDEYTVLAFIHVRKTFHYCFEESLDFKINQHPASKKTFINACFQQVLIPNHSSAHSWLTPLAQFILYWRGHLIRMPLTMLVPHLWHKTFITPFTRYKKEQRQKNQDNNQLN